MAISKQDIVSPRTAADIDRKYNFGKSFAEVAGIATDARKTAETASKAVENLDENLSAEEIFNRLTDNGQVQGMYRENGQIYINAEYIVALASLFAKDITMTGKFTCETEGYIAPDDEAIETMKAHILGQITIPAGLIPDYDFNVDGQLTSADLRRARLMQLGQASMSDWPNARKTPVVLEIDMSNAEKAIRISGKNMWGRDVDRYIGINGTNIPHVGTVDYVVEQGESSDGMWRYSKWNSGRCELCGIASVLHPVGGGTADIQCSVSYPFVVENPVVSCQVGAYGWNIARPIYTAVGTSGLSATLYPRTDVGGNSYLLHMQIKGYWK